MTRAFAPRVLVVYKRSTYERYGGARDARVRRLLADGDPSVRHLLAAHDSHRETLERCRAALASLGANARFVHHYEPKVSERYDLVVTLGGDGTLLYTSHRIGKDVPMLAVNSAPLTSVGFFCAGSGARLESLLRRALGGKLPETKLTRMQLSLDGKVFHRRVLNDILFCHANPAAATRYVLEVRGRVEEQLSSGIWVGPAAGSTAAQRSAGGVVLPADSTKLQFVVREPYLGLGPPQRLLKGLLEEGQQLVLRSKIREGMVFVDGHDLRRRVDIGGEVALCASDEPLTMLGLRRDAATGTLRGPTQRARRLRA